jgi:uncharacterized membrane protein YecN with MAPEG domain
MHPLVALVTLLAVLTYVWTGFLVGQARGASGIQAPAMTGDPRLERAVRVQTNTLEWMPIFLPCLWLFVLPAPAHSLADLFAAGLGVVWIVGRVVYGLGYMADPAKRSLGFMIQALACLLLLAGAFLHTGLALLHGG